MTRNWEPNEDIDENEELVVTEHRDLDHPTTDADDEQAVETTAADPHEALEELGEDVASSPAQRGRD